MHRCYLDPSSWEQGEPCLSEEEARHLVRVLRVRVGDVVEVFDGRDRVGRAEVLDAESGTVRLRVAESATAPPPDRPVVLFQALIREPKMDLVVQKGVELGVREIVPFSAARSVVRLKGEGFARKRKRWQRIARGAATQCGSAWVPPVRPASGLAEALEGRPPFSLLLLGDLEAGSQALVEALRARQPLPAGPVGVIVGPEGDLDPEEKEAAASAGAIGVSLGPRVLRAETAALFMLSALVYEGL